MAIADLTPEFLREILDYDHDTGVFTWKVRRSSRAGPGDKAGTVHPTTGYIVIGINGEMCQAHRLAWIYVYGKHPEADIDHINGIRTCNVMSNLRDVSRRVNTENRRDGQGHKIRVDGCPLERKGWIFF